MLKRVVMQSMGTFFYTGVLNEARPLCCGEIVPYCLGKFEFDQWKLDLQLACFCAGLRRGRIWRCSWTYSSTIKQKKYEVTAELWLSPLATAVPAMWLAVSFSEQPVIIHGEGVSNSNCTVCVRACAHHVSIYDLCVYMYVFHSFSSTVIHTFLLQASCLLNEN